MQFAVFDLKKSQWSESQFIISNALNIYSPQLNAHAIKSTIQMLLCEVICLCLHKLKKEAITTKI